MNKIQIYLAGAMEAHDGTNYATEWRNSVKKYFDSYCENVNVISPPEYYKYGEHSYKTHKEVFDFDLFKVRKSDVVLVDLYNIRKSVGTCMELKESHTYGIPVIGFIKEKLPLEDMIQLIHPWVYCCCNRIETGEDSLNLAMHYIKNYYC